MDKLDQIAIHHPDNIIFTSYEFRTRADVEKAFVGSGMILDPSCRVQYIDGGLLATFRAGVEDGEMESWFAIAWGTMREDERQTWLNYWRLLERITDMSEHDLSTMTTEELYAFKDRLQTMRDQVRGRRGPGPTHTRDYCRTMREQINAVLKSRNAPLRPLGSEQRVYGPGAAPWQKG